MTVERVTNILINYIDNDLLSAEIGYVREVLCNIATKEELQELGLWDWLCFEEEE